MSETKPTPLKGELGCYEYDWINSPPVIELTAISAVRGQARQMKASINEYDRGEHEIFDDQKDNQTNEVDDWNCRVKDAHKILKLIIHNEYECEYNVVYRVFGKVVGILCASRGKDNSVHVFYLVTHPATYNAGGALLELAADWSEEKERGGRLDLDSFSGNSTEAYAAMGFIKEDRNYKTGGKMTLDPGTCSETWKKVGKNWKLAKYLGKGYYKGSKKAPSLLPGNT